MYSICTCTRTVSQPSSTFLSASPPSFSLLLVRPPCRSSSPCCITSRHVTPRRTAGPCPPPRSPRSHAHHPLTVTGLSAAIVRMLAPRGCVIVSSLSSRKAGSKASTTCERSSRILSCLGYRAVSPSLAGAAIPICTRTVRVLGWTHTGQRFSVHNCTVHSTLQSPRSASAEADLLGHLSQASSTSRRPRTRTS